MDYGNRVGFWRTLNVLNKHELRACCCLNLEILDHFPEIKDAVSGTAITNPERQLPTASLCAFDREGVPALIDTLSSIRSRTSVSHIKMSWTSERVWRNIRQLPRGKYKP